MEYNMLIAYLINRYYSDEWLHEDANRVPPHMDQEVTEMRNKCLKRYFDNVGERSKVTIEFGKFSGCSGQFADSDCIHNRYHMDPYTWWCAYGAFAPALQKVALRILGQPASSSCCERNWSTYSFVHSVKRNKMTPQRAEDLVFVHSNLRLLSRKTPQYSQGQTKMWDIAGDTFDSLDDVGILGVAELSLDEPELEAVVFTDDGDGDDAHGEEDIAEVEAL